MKLKRIAGFVISSLLLLTSCNSQPVAVNTPTATIIKNDPRPTATIESTVTPSPTLSPVRETETNVQTQVARAVQTQEHFVFTEVPATLGARNVKCKDGFVLEQAIEILRVSNDQWTLFTCSPEPENQDERWTPGVVDYGTRYTQVTKNDLSRTWIIEHSAFDYSKINRADALMVPYRWTADGRYLYLYPMYYPGGSGFPRSASLLTIINSLYRINLESGAFELVLRGDQFSALSLSPDDQFLVYSEQEKPNIIHIKNMESGDDFHVQLNEDIIAAGAFVWDAESTKVVVTLGYGKQSEDWQDDLSGTAIYVLTLKNRQAQRVLAKNSRFLMPYQCDKRSYWIDEDTMCLISTNEELESWNTVFTINLKTGKVTHLRPYP